MLIPPNLLLVQYDDGGGRIVVLRPLSRAELAVLADRPDILSRPARALDALAGAVRGGAPARPGRPDDDGDRHPVAALGGDLRAGDVTWSGAFRVKLCSHLGPDWRELADFLEVAGHEQGKFGDGYEARDLLKYLELRGRLGEVPDALRQIGRTDLLEFTHGML
ncbi:hypothetical protein [Paractinoplanes bogorensis]|uniref:hypothetical protein n=1 Tax=Paractinoplanes bogorensis TaxID=1610840 RepID=UPI0034DAD18D